MDEEMEAGKEATVMNSLVAIAEAFQTVQSQTDSLRVSVNDLAESALKTTERTILMGSMLESVLRVIKDVVIKPTATPEESPPLQPTNQEQQAMQQMVQKLENLQSELDNKSLEVRKLHEIILQNGNQRDEPLTDDQVSGMFDRLSQSVLRVVSSHFHTASPRGTYKDGPDFRFLMRAKIAAVLDRVFLASSAKFFCLPPFLEKEQQRLEQYFQSKAINEDEVAEWRILVVKMGIKVNGNERKLQHPVVRNTGYNLYKDLHQHCLMPTNIVDHPAQRALDELCEEAWSLAVRLRMSRNTYFWCQGEHYFCRQSSNQDVERIQPYPTNSMESGYFHMIFGPLYKIIDNEKILIRKGEILSAA